MSGIGRMFALRDRIAQIDKEVKAKKKEINKLELERRQREMEYAALERELL